MTEKILENITLRDSIHISSDNQNKLMDRLSTSPATCHLKFVLGCNGNLVRRCAGRKRCGCNQTCRLQSFTDTECDQTN